MPVVSSSDNNNYNTIIALAIALLAACCCLFLIVAFLLHRRQHKAKNDAQADLDDNEIVDFHPKKRAERNESDSDLFESFRIESNGSLQIIYPFEAKENADK